MSNIVDFLKEIKEESKKVSTDYDILIMLNDICKKKNISFSFEEIVNDKELRLHTERGVPFFNQTSRLGRVLFSVSNKFQKFTETLSQQCNGLVVDSFDWRILAMPIAPLNIQYNMAVVEENYTNKKYNVYKIFDGTTITLYYYNDWTISTARGLSMNNVKWFSNKSYFSMLNEIFEKNNINIDKFNKGFSYCLGFRHPEQHPFNNEMQLWFIKKTNLKTLEDIWHDDELNIQNYIPEKEPPQTFKALIAANNNALKNYIKEPKNINFGYILRGDSKKLGGNANILLESSLMKKIRQFIYNINTKKTNIFLDEHNRLEFISLRAFLNYPSRKTFSKLFPKLSKEFKRYNSAAYKITERIIQCYRNNNIKLGNSDIDECAQLLIEQIDKSRLKVNMFDSTARNIIYEYIIDAANIDLFANLLFK